MLKSLRILGKTFAIREYPKGRFSDETLGYSDSTTQVLDIRADQGEDQKRDTLIHEALHAIDYALLLDLQERQIHALAAGFYALLRDNPDLAPYLMEESE